MCKPSLDRAHNIVRYVKDLSPDDVVAWFHQGADIYLLLDSMAKYSKII